MWWTVVAGFFLGCLVGGMIMALLAISKKGQ